MLSFFILALAAQAASAPAAAQAAPAAQDCTAHKFEKIVTATVDGTPKTSRLRLCGTAGQSDAQWLATLKDSANKLTLNFKMQAPMREAMVAALKAEIARLEGRAADSASMATSAGPITLKRRDGAAAPAAGIPGYNALPPMPAPMPAASVTLGQAPKPPPAVARPPIRLECTTPGGAEGPCTEFERATYVVVAARGPVQPGVSLRFLRDGEQRAEVNIGAMKKGQTRRFALPAQVCKGVTSAQLSVETMATPPVKGAAPQRTTTDGPFYLRCF